VGNREANVFQVVEYSGTALRVEMRGHQFLRLIKEPNSCVLFYGRVHTSPRANLNMIEVGDGQVTCNNNSVNFDHVPLNHQFSLSPGANPHPGQPFAQPISLLKVVNIFEAHKIFYFVIFLGLLFLLWDLSDVFIELVRINEILVESIERIKFFLLL